MTPPYVYSPAFLASWPRSRQPAGRTHRREGGEVKAFLRTTTVVFQRTIGTDEGGDTGRRSTQRCPAIRKRPPSTSSKPVAGNRQGGAARRPGVDRLPGECPRAASLACFDSTPSDPGGAILALNAKGPPICAGLSLLESVDNVRSTRLEGGGIL